MAVGDVVRLEFPQQTDPETGVLVERLTDDVGRSHHPYFTQPVITADGRHVLFSSDRGGRPNVYRAQVRT